MGFAVALFVAVVAGVRVAVTLPAGFALFAGLDFEDEALAFGAALIFAVTFTSTTAFFGTDFAAVFAEPLPAVCFGIVAFTTTVLLLDFAEDLTEDFGTELFAAGFVLPFAEALFGADFEDVPLFLPAPLFEFDADFPALELTADLPAFFAIVAIKRAWLWSGGRWLARSSLPNREVVLNFYKNDW